MDLSVVTLLFLICCLWDSEARYYHHQHIWVENGIKTGYFRGTSLCLGGHAYGFSLKVQEHQGGLLSQDDTSLNGIRLYCSDGAIIQNIVGPYGVWTAQQYCSSGNLNAFSLRVDPIHGWGMLYDDTAANNIQFKCESGETLEGYGHNWGTFGKWSSCHFGAICGFKTKVEYDENVIDHTSLNDVVFLCCPYDR